MTQSQFSKYTLDYIARAELSHRKALGQYFTPKYIQDRLLSYIPNQQQNARILDPACGTGEFLISAANRFPQAHIEGWELDPNLADVARQACSKAQVVHTNALESEFTDSFDVVLGNPPYFEETPSPYIKSRYGEIISGRYNIYAAFIYLGLQLIKDDGYLAFVVPPSMNNGAYFKKLREYILSVANIVKIDVLDKTTYFDSAQQLTMIIVLQKKKRPTSRKYVCSVDGITIFSQHYLSLNKQLAGATNLNKLGYSVRTGRIVWNQNKERLTNDSRDSLLIWSHNITPRGLELNNKPHKPQYISHPSPNIGPAIVVNRITGAAHSVKIRAAFVPEGQEFFAENHVNVIFPPKNSDGSSKYTAAEVEHVYKEITHEKTSKLFAQITGNTQVSKNELEFLLPIGDFV